MEMDDKDESQFGVVKDTTKTIQWFVDNAEHPNYEKDPDFETSVCV